MLFCERAWLLFPFYPCPINCFILKKSALCRVGFNDIVYNNKHLLLIWRYSVQTTSCLLWYFRISMWSVKTSVWSVSGLKGNSSIWESIETRSKAKHLFSHWLQKKLSYYFAFSIFLHKFANVNHVRNLIGWCRVWQSVERRVRPLWSSAKAEGRRGWGRVAHEERLDCG